MNRVEWKIANAVDAHSCIRKLYKKCGWNWVVSSGCVGDGTDMQIKNLVNHCWFLQQ